jgi:hypothetical protein
MVLLLMEYYGQIMEIIGCALDLDNNKLYFSINGVWQNSGDPTSGATGTGAISYFASTYFVWYPNMSKF